MAHRLPPSSSARWGDSTVARRNPDLERLAIACVPCVGAILVIALGRRGQGEYKIRPYQETKDTSE